jgi:hypothetical protein
VQFRVAIPAADPPDNILRSNDPRIERCALRPDVEFP